MKDDKSLDPSADETEDEKVEPAEPTTEPAESDAVEDDASEEAEPAEAQEPVEVLSEEQAQIRDLQAQLDASGKRLRAVSKGYTELQEEMKGFRERMEHRARLNSELQAFSGVKAFFDPVMNLRRSIANPGTDVDALVGGLKMVDSQFMTALKSLGLEEIPGEGAKFDPNLHEALAIMPVTDADQDGKVIQVHSVGFQVNGKTLQASQVIVGKFQEKTEEA